MLKVFNPEPQDREDCLGCRIIEDNNGRYQYLPYYQRPTYKHPYEFQIFGDPRAEHKTTYPNLNEDTTDKASAHREGLQVRWSASVSRETGNFVQGGRNGSGLSLQRLNTQTVGSISRVTEMWDDLVGLLRREKTVVFRKQAEFLEDSSNMGISSKSVMRGHVRSGSDIERLHLRQTYRQRYLKTMASMRIFKKSRTGSTG